MDKKLNNFLDELSREEIEAIKQEAKDLNFEEIALLLLLASSEEDEEKYE
ncbi:hypothetical protein Bp8pS_310 [Bacillus phage vB_BpuM-BpSp]|nr:hypothetical protein Bp8pS_310 [Bacillus phage vB_BpuM-BpSp]